MIGLEAKKAPAELRAAVLAMKRADGVIRKDISNRMRSTMGPVWRSEVTGRAPGGMAARMLTPGVRIAAGNPPRLIAASSRRKIGNGLVPDVNAAGYEFGASDAVRRVTNRKGTTYERHVMRHLPGRNRKGRAVFPAAAKMLPRIAAYWTQSVVRAFMDAAEGKE